MLRTILLLILFVITVNATAQKGNPVKPGKEDITWIQKILDNWDYVCKNELKIEIKPLPWSIFYDSSYAWHLNAEEKFLPFFERSNDSVLFAGVSYRLIRVAHQNGVWVPDREAVPVSSMLTTAAPYDQNKKAFFMAPLPSWFHKMVPPDQAFFIDFLFLGTNIHELTHTRQLPFVLPQLLQLQKESGRESLDDNTVEKVFSQNEKYKRYYLEVNRRLWKAYYTADVDSSLSDILLAAEIMESRKRNFFIGKDKALAKADEIFLSLEGSAMWAQYRVMFKNTPNPIERELLTWLVQQMPAWSQEKGLVLFLLIDRFVPDWKKRFFEKELPLATRFLVTELARRKADKEE